MRSRSIPAPRRRFKGLQGPCPAFTTPRSLDGKGTLMQNLIWIGAFVSLVGVAGLIWCVLIALRARREGLDDNAMKARLQRVVVINTGALFLSAIGLMIVVIGILLG